MLITGKATGFTYAICPAAVVTSLAAGFADTTVIRPVMRAGKSTGLANPIVIGPVMRIANLTTCGAYTVGPCMTAA